MQLRPGAELPPKIKGKSALIKKIDISIDFLEKYVSSENLNMLFIKEHTVECEAMQKEAERLAELKEKREKTKKKRAVNDLP
jgi:hypothetical protein